MAYKYDVFISYPRGKDKETGKKSIIENWVNEIFYPILKDRLQNSYHRDVKIFIDKKEISTGTPWREYTINAVARSRCLIAIWSSWYFRKEWCQLELSMMLYRAKMLKQLNPEKVYRLILPICACDGICFPEWANDIQQRMWNQYVRENTDGYRQSQRYLDFQDEMDYWVQNEVVKTINQSPKWNKVWLDKDCINAGIKEINFSAKLKKNFELTLAKY